MAFWWVNHKQTREHEIRGGYLWSPCRNANGAFNQSYENMRHVRVGDIVFSYANGRIGAIGRVTVAATPCPKPTEFGNVGDYWLNEGWLVEAEFVPVPKALAPKQRIEIIGPMLPTRHSPLQANGNGNQGCYLAGISDALGHLLLALTEADALSARQSRVSARWASTRATKARAAACRCSPGYRRAAAQPGTAAKRGTGRENHDVRARGSPGFRPVGPLPGLPKPGRPRAVVARVIAAQRRNPGPGHKPRKS